MLLLDRIAQLEQKINELQSKIEDLTKNTEQKYATPITIAGGIKNNSFISPVDISTGFGNTLGNGVIWNSSELGMPPINSEVPVPDEVLGRGYNKHTHSRFSGGALIVQALELVQYTDSDWALIQNPHSQQFWQINPEIKTIVNKSGATVKMIGSLDLVFNPDCGTDSNGNPIGKWTVATNEIDVSKCNFVIRRTTDGDGQKAGDIQNDSKGNPMKGLLYDEDQTKTSIIWDEEGLCWRFFAIYSPGTPDGK